MYRLYSVDVVLALSAAYARKLPKDVTFNPQPPSTIIVPCRIGILFHAEHWVSPSPKVAYVRADKSWHSCERCADVYDGLRYLNAAPDEQSVVDKLAPRSIPEPLASTSQSRLPDHTTSMAHC